MATINITNQAKPNIPPVVNAGGDQSINLPETTISLVATANDPDGYITSIQWTKVSGGAGIITNPTALNSTVTGLQPGTYVFQIVVFDNFGDSATDTVTIEVGSYQIYPFIWVTNSTTCETSESGGFTGNVKVLTLKKVSNDSDAFPLDINNQRVFYTGLPQAIKNNVPENSDYVAPYQDLTACPRGRFYSVMSSPKAWNGTITHPDGGVTCGEGVHAGSLDNATVIENTLSGAVLKNFNNPSGILFVIPTTGTYSIQLVGSGSAAMSFVNSSTQFGAPLDLILKINSTQYLLSPITSTLFDCPTQYRFSKLPEEGNGPSFNYNMSLNLASIALNAGDVIDAYFAVRIFGTGTYAGRNGSCTVNLNACSLEIKQL